MITFRYGLLWKTADVLLCRDFMFSRQNFKEDSQVFVGMEVILRRRVGILSIDSDASCRCTSPMHVADGARLAVDWQVRVDAQAPVMVGFAVWSVAHPPLYTARQKRYPQAQEVACDRPAA